MNEQAPKLKVGDLARLTGKTVRALHLYEELGLLRPAERSAGGYRLYDMDAATRVEWIGKLQEMGFSLGEVQEFARSLERSTHAPLAMLRARGIFQEKLRATRDHITKLRSLERDLEQGLAYLEVCGGCDAEEEGPLCSSCARPHEMPPPILVTGMQRT